MFLSWLLLLVGCEPMDSGSPSPPPAPCVPGAAAMVGGTPYADLQSAIDTAHGPTVVTVCRGTWRGPLLYRTPGPLWLQGETGVAADVVLDGWLGWQPRGEPILRGDPNLPAQRLRVTGMTFFGGWSDRSAAHIGEAGGITLDAPQGELWVENSVFELNGSQYGGGAISSTAGRVLLEDTEFLDNSSLEYGGALRLELLEGQVQVRRCLFGRNTSSMGGGAARITLGSLLLPLWADLTVEESTWSGNRGYQGGAVWIDQGVPGSTLLQDMEMVGNEASLAGGALFLQGTGGPGYSTIIERAQLRNNRAAAAAAIAVGSNWLQPAYPVSVRGGAILDHRSTVPGALGVIRGGQLQLDGVDLGSGQRDNDRDALGCGRSFGAGIVGTIDALARDFCP